eukprot:CAMPEP_0172746156 /NCGR_PEP_ID=MMETSP1074-20121228/139765_1 /TAXON_ID=2916 /ORGANISM="Ceratium fusus, Strain PA161109" /LENGTH=81 /DNA_ID=CAMNT_0013577455 /DNA_START=437 /DNA_END=682 /DNA_ORIENTATION=+
MIPLLKTCPSAKLMLASTAAKTPSHVNETSVEDAPATPPAINSRVSHARDDSLEPMKTMEKIAAKSGSEALTLCMKETLTS